MGFLLNLDLANVLGNGPVGQQHKFFHQLVGFLAFLYHDADGLPFFIQLKTHFGGRKIDRALFEPLAAQALGDIVAGARSPAGADPSSVR